MMAHDQWAMKIGPEAWDKKMAKMDSVQHPSSMEQPPHVPIDPDTRTHVMVPLRMANIPFEFDPSWELSEP
jgi:hypothetical protein